MVDRSKGMKGQQVFRGRRPNLEESDAIQKRMKKGKTDQEMRTLRKKVEQGPGVREDERSRGLQAQQAAEQGAQDGLPLRLRVSTSWRSRQLSSMSRSLMRSRTRRHRLGGVSVRLVMLYWKKRVMWSKQQRRFGS